jgi:hypothetical protein
MSRRREASLVDVLIGIGIVVLTVGILLPALTRHRYRGAVSSSSANNLKQIALAIHDYNGAWGTLPPLVDVGAGAPNGAGLNSLFFNILPYVEYSDVYRMVCPPTPNTYYAPGAGAAQTVIKVFISPADFTAPNGTLTNASVTLSNAPPAPFAQSFTGSYATTSYAANGQIPWNTGGLPRSFKDGASVTILFAERPQVCTAASGQKTYNLWGFGAYGPGTPAFALLTPSSPAGLPSTGQVAPVLPLPPRWRADSIPVQIGTDSAPAQPSVGRPFQIVRPDQPCDPRLPGTPHAGGMLVALADGSVRTISPKISDWTFWAACTPDGKESLYSDW